MNFLLSAKVAVRKSSKSADFLVASAVLSAGRVKQVRAPSLFEKFCERSCEFLRPGSIWSNPAAAPEKAEVCAHLCVLPAACASLSLSLAPTSMYMTVGCVLGANTR
jgi:hypothetical protein